MVGGLFGGFYISPGFQLGVNSSKEFFLSYQTTFGLSSNIDVGLLSDIDGGFPGITLGRRHYKTGLNEWNSYNYIDAQIAFTTIGLGAGIIFDNSNIFYKYKLFTGFFGLATCDYVTFKDKPKIHFGAFGVYPISD